MDNIHGRPGSNLKAGLVGLPNVGKSSFFNVLCSMEVPAENYPFCTIDPSVSRVEIPDERFDWLCEHFKPQSRVRQFLQITDIAGLVKGAAEGQGLGNAFLSHIQAVDCIFHVVRAFDDTEIAHVEDSVDPVRDLDIISKELIQKDCEWCDRRLDTAQKKAKLVKGEQKELQMLMKVKEHLSQGKNIRDGDWSPAEVELLNTMQLLTAKRSIVLINLSEQDYVKKKNKWIPKIKTWVDEHAPSDTIIPVSCVLEKKLVSMDEAERKTFCESNSVQSCLTKVIHAGKAALNMQCFFTAGADEVKAWGIQVGTKAPQAAGCIHSDFERGFIMAETMAFEDLKSAGSVNNVKTAGKYKMNGKDYVVQDGDIINFKV
ncbi:hypothetical protein GUITHDRAFT_75397 [Guillardia theta CCMP2712]|uniref:Obg-like ATPase 1 n=1 Tax=Guillardia theta (strain CCMP2712) TaxID=905079 RepID=L1IXM8_GUITC|nr:hypothetical protein GUITHDRAFT_75397 [Guillardia theta CCMP2712]EKX40600.1 hypothetical protein GUITHDRAFT_75397 [Guillardia theta CCMP2712]|eukprot:XP_005827580.1 hypothetical protein GUITHDRAFT_75397 [Guillardia theta CCMP2712]